MSQFTVNCIQYIQNNGLFFFLFFRVVNLFKARPGESHPNHTYYRSLYPKIMQDIEVRVGKLI